MDRMILIDLETQDFFVESGIYEVAALVVENWEIKDKFYLGEVQDESLVNIGYGVGFKDISDEQKSIDKFKNFINKYNYPLVAHYGSFDRRFLIHYGWISEEYPFYDSIRAIRYENPWILSYSLAHLRDFVGLEMDYNHTAMGDIELTFEVLKFFKPQRWLPIGTRMGGYNGKSHPYTAIKEDFEVIKTIFSGKNIVFTGKGPYTRNELMQLAKKCGADITSNTITKKTNLLVVGEKPGSKYEKAKELGIEIMDMDDFYHMIDGVKLDDVQQAAIKNSAKKSNEILSNKLAGECVTPYPMTIAMSEKITKLVEKHGGKTVPGLRKKETTILVYQGAAEDLATVKKAKDYNIRTMTAGAFDRYVQDLLGSGDK